MNHELHREVINPPTQIEEIIMAQEAAIANLREELSILEAQLQCVLIPQPEVPKENDTTHPDGLCQIAEQLHRHNIKLSQTAQILQSLRRQLAV